MRLRASRCLETNARGPPILRGAPRQGNWDYPVASSFVRWRTEQWEGNPIACDCESSFQANNGSVRLSLTTQSSDLAFEPEHGKGAQLLSSPARSLARALPPLLRSASESTWEPTPIWWRYRATRSTTPRAWTRTSSSTTVCTGCTHRIAGTPAPGTTGRGTWWPLSRCRCSYCEFRFATTDSRLGTLAAGGPKCHPAGASTGVVTGNSVAVAGIAGTAPPLLRRLRCRRTSASIRGRAIPVWISNRLFRTRTTI